MQLKCLFCLEPICSKRCLWGSSNKTGDFGRFRTFPQLDFCSFARLATSAFFAQTISTAVPTVSSNKVEKRDERWDFKAFSHHSSWVQHHCQQFWLPHVQPGSWPQVKEKEESIAHCGPFAAESVQKVSNQKNSRYVVSELDRRDILEDVSIQYKS